MFQQIYSDLTNEDNEKFIFGVKDGVRGFYTNPSRADDCFIPFNLYTSDTFMMYLFVNYSHLAVYAYTKDCFETLSTDAYGAIPSNPYITFVYNSGYCAVKAKQNCKITFKRSNGLNTKVVEATAGNTYNLWAWTTEGTHFGFIEIKPL